MAHNCTAECFLENGLRSRELALLHWFDRVCSISQACPKQVLPKQVLRFVTGFFEQMGKHSFVTRRSDILELLEAFGPSTHTIKSWKSRKSLATL